MWKDGPSSSRETLVGHSGLRGFLPGVVVVRGLDDSLEGKRSEDGGGVETETQETKVQDRGEIMNGKICNIYTRDYILICPLNQLVNDTYFEVKERTGNLLTPRLIIREMRISFT